jgi:mRNA interferase YafQ
MENDITQWKKHSENLIDRKFKTIVSSRFKKSWKKYIKSGKYNKEQIEEILLDLSRGIKLDDKYRDHELKGDWTGHRECHVQSNLLLVYKIEGDEITLVKLGSHPELFG